MAESAATAKAPFTSARATTNGAPPCHSTAVALVASFLLLNGARALALGQPLLPEIAPITGPMYQLFIFFMITDPRTVETVRMSRAAESRPAMRLSAFDGLPTTVVAFATDIPTFNGAWGQPFLIGPGSIHLAHTAEERIPKQQLSDAVDIYARMVRQLLATGGPEA